MNSGNISIPLKGMNTDLNPLSLNEQQYSYALNAVYEEIDGNGFPILQNEKSNILGYRFSKDISIVASKYIPEQNRLIVFLYNNKTGISEIGEFINLNNEYIKTDSLLINNELVEDIPLEKIKQKNFLNYYKIVESYCLNFTKSNLISIEYKISDCNIQLYFVDGYNVDRYLYLNYSGNNLIVDEKFNTILNYSDNDCKIPNYSTELDCEKLSMQPNIDKPCLLIDSVTTGGSLKAGSYQFFFAYSNKSGEALTSYTALTNIIPIFSKKITIDTDYETNLCINLNIEGQSTESIYSNYNIAVAETINNYTTYKLIGTFPITQKNYTYTGIGILKVLNENDIIQKYPYYKNSKKITKSNNYLFKTHLKEFNKPNLQRVANNIVLEWQTLQVPENFYKNLKSTSLFRSFLRDEIYSFGIVFEYNNGEESPVYHIPGREATNYDNEIINNADVLSIDGITYNKRWQVYNTASKLGEPHIYNKDLKKQNIWEYGSFSYWESTETYPNIPDIWGNLCGKKIRHHKFPDRSITHIHDGLNLNKNINSENYIYPIGIKINHNQIKTLLTNAVNEGLITNTDLKRIRSYRIVRGNRVGNKSIIAKGLVYDMYNYSKYNNKYYYANYPYNDLREDPFISSRDFYDGNRIKTPNVFENTGRYTFHSPDVHFVEPVLGSILKVETEEYGTSEGFFNECLNQAEHRIVASTAFDIALKFSTNLANDLDIGSQTDSGASSLGSALGGVVGSAFGGPIGGSIGTAFGKALGGLLADSTGGDSQDLAESLTKLSFSMYNYEKYVEIFKSMLPYHNYHVQYNSKGVYNNFKLPLKGNINRVITNSSYLNPELSSISENNTSTFVNNWGRESSVYLKVNKILATPTIKDVSRITMALTNCQLNDSHKSAISSYYVSIKDNKLNPYGNIYDIKYIELGNCSYNLKNNYTNQFIFGGDTFINQFSLKRKMSHFVTNTYKLPNDVDFYYSMMANVGYPIYYLNTKTVTDFYIGNPFSIFNVTSVASGILGLGSSIVVPSIINILSKGSLPQSNLMCMEERFSALKTFTNKGYISLYNYGVPVFFVESDINVDLRHGENNKEKDFYPNQLDFNYWLQEKNVSPLEDNYYFYNKSYSKQIKESFLEINDPNFKPNNECKVVYPNRIIYSEQSNNIDDNDLKDNWLIFKALNKYDFSFSNGNLVSAKGIENDKVLVRFENTTQVFNAYVTIPNSADTIQIGNGGMFQSKPQEYSKTDLGYAGTQNTPILQTEFGHIWVDAKRGQVFNLNSSSGLNEISKNGMKNWFKENLPFHILKDFNNIDVDNSINGIGINLCYDKRFNRILITKKDYKLLDKLVTYNKELNKFFKNNTEIFLNDNNYFCDSSWTISYNLFSESWCSFHSYNPNDYISLIDFFISANDNELWLHNLTNKSYQVFNEKLYPFIIETISKPGLDQKVLKNINFTADVIRYHNNIDNYNNFKILPFNKAIIYNNQSSSGLLKFEKTNKTDMSKFIEYPRIKDDCNIIEITNRENVWKFNQFYNLLNHSLNIPMFLTNSSSTDKIINPLAFNYLQDEFSRDRLRGEWFKIRLSQDYYSNYKIIFKWLLNNSYLSKS